MYTITFYSFKGGVGRTMALVNVAAQLAKMGRKVLVVDFDLEAPGLETFERLRPPQPHPGLVEFVTEYVRSKRSPDVRDYIYSAGKVGKKDGQLWVMPAGRRDRDYHLALSRLDWKKLYDEYEGFLFFEDLKAQWEQEYKFDYVLIDSRTGDTDVKGICTRQLPDAVVALFIPNEQNLVGLKRVCEEIRQERWTGLKKDIPLHFVMSNVPDLDDEDRYPRAYLREFCNKHSFYIPASIHIIHRSESIYPLAQMVILLRLSHTRLAAEYRSLVRSLQIDNSEDRRGALLFLRFLEKYRSSLLEIDDPHLLWKCTIFRPQGDHWIGTQNELMDLIKSSIKSGRRLPQKDDWTLQHPIPDVVTERVDRITEQFWEDAEILFRVGKYFTRDNPRIALERFARVLEIQPDFTDALFERALCNKRLGDNAAAAKDLLHYLIVYGSQEPDWDQLDTPSKILLARESMPYCYPNDWLRDPLFDHHDPLDDPDYSTWEFKKAKQISRGRKKNEAALLELLSISLDEFMKTLELPPLQLPRGTSQDPYWLLNTITERLIQQRRWEEAIRWLEQPIVKKAIEKPEEAPWNTFGKSAWHAFFLAMARWGKEGEPDREFCSQARSAFQSILDQQTFGPEFQKFQTYSMLSWAAGDSKGAASALDKALENLDVEEGNDQIYHVSYWSFLETTWREFRLDCQEMRRMIEGAPIRPAFLGSVLAGRAREFTSPSVSLPK